MLLVTYTCASPIPEDEEASVDDKTKADAEYMEMMYQTAVENRELPVSDPSLADFNLNTALGGLQNLTANLTALIQYLVQLEVNRTITALTAIQNFTGISKQNDIKTVEQPVELNNKPLFYVRRRPDFYPGPHHPSYFYNPYFAQFHAPNPYMYHSPPEYRRPINPTNDESLSDAEAMEQLTYLYLNERSGAQGDQDPEARGLLSSLSASSLAAKNSFKSFFNSLSGQISVTTLTKTILVPSLTVNG